MTATGDEQMAYGARLSTVVMFVRELERSVRFYTELLELTTADRSPTAALLVSDETGTHLVLRAMGPSAVHPLGSAGVQYVVWTVAGDEELSRIERVLKAHSAHSETRDTHGVTSVEGRDPDGVPVIVCHPGPDQLPPSQQHLWTRIYAW